MKEYIISADDVKTIEEEFGIILSFEKDDELTRCKDCKLNGFCVLSHTELAGEGYCAWAKPKEEKDDR